MINDSGVDAAATLPSPFTSSQGSFSSDLGSNQLGVLTQHSIGSSQGSQGIAPYGPLSGGLQGSPVCGRVETNPLGRRANVFAGPFVADRAGDGVQVSLSLFPSVRCSDKRASIDNA